MENCVTGTNVRAKFEAAFTCFACFNYAMHKGILIANSIAINSLKCCAGAGTFFKCNLCKKTIMNQFHETFI